VNLATTLSIFNDIGIDGEKVEEFENAQTIQLPLGHLRWNQNNSNYVNSKPNKIYRCLKRSKWEEGSNITEPINVWFNFGTNKWMLLCRQREFNYNIKMVARNIKSSTPLKGANEPNPKSFYDLWGFGRLREFG